MDKVKEADMKGKKGKFKYWKCTCIVCNCTWTYPIKTKEDEIRASCSPCGHQGLFKVERILK